MGSLGVRWLGSCACALVATGCTIVLGIEELPRAEDIADAAPPPPGECTPGTERCKDGNGHERCDEQGTWKDDPCPALEPVCSGSSCTHVARVAGGLGQHTCAVLADGTVRCWGWNENQQIGAPFEGSHALFPSVVGGISGVRSGATSHITTCVAHDDGTGHCWGENGDAQLGGPAGPATPEPREVELADIDEIAPGSYHTCARTHAGAVHCWGSDEYGQLGHGSIGADAVAPGPAVELPGAAHALCSGSAFTCAVLADETMWCWGRNDAGVFGNGTDGTASGSPVQVPLTGVLGVTCGNLHVCARTAAGVACAGNNDCGQTGFAEKTHVKTMVDVALPPGPPIEQLCAGWRQTCARRFDGQVLCWGRNTSGDLGTGRLGELFNHVPSFVVSLPAAAKDLACYWRGGCVLLEDATVRCWGQGDAGQLGNGSNPDASSTPTPVVWAL